MSFIVKNSQLSNESLNSLNSLIEQDINATAAFKLIRIIKFLSSIVEDKVKAEKLIFDKWTQKDENGHQLKAKDENGHEIPDTVLLSDIDSFSKEMSDLLNVENEIPFEKINFEDLQLKTIKIKDLIKIEFLFEDIKS
jgi:hypothetical protein